MLKIATWNLDRPRASSQTKINRILEILKGVNADILVLTETNSCINPGEEYKSFATQPLLQVSERDDVQYTEGENRVTIWSKFNVHETVETYDPVSAVCVSVDTPQGDLIVYGTVIGYLGNRHKSFSTDLDAQIEDWRKLCKSGNSCIVGDLNTSFGDNYYFTKAGREKLSGSFQEFRLIVPTREIEDNIDQIAISESFLSSVTPITGMWNRPRDNKVSDHIGVSLTF